MAIGIMEWPLWSHWGCSIHEAFNQYPYGYRVIAQHKKSDLPYIIAGHRA